MTSDALTLERKTGAVTPKRKTDTLTPELLRKMHAYWRAANYLSVGQIYLYDNPLLREPLKLAHVKPLVVGHWGTTPGQSFIYVHLNRIIKKYDLDMFYIAGPGHGDPLSSATSTSKAPGSRYPYPLKSRDSTTTTVSFRTGRIHRQTRGCWRSRKEPQIVPGM